jgi:hypothetical protein
MAECKITQGIESSCDDVLKVGGLDKTFWVGYLSDLDTAFPLTQTTPVRTIDFGGYGALYRFDGRKYSHTFSQPLQVAAGGNKSYAQTFIAKLLADSVDDDVTLQRLALSDDIFIIFQDNNRKLKIVGASRGLQVTTDEQSSGQTGDADLTSTITFTGAEVTKALYFELEAGYDATIAYLEALEA